MSSALYQALCDLATARAERNAAVAATELPEDEPEEDDGDFCPGCNPEPTISELENGRCDSCGKELL